MGMQSEQVIWATPLTANDTNAKEQLGVKRVEDDVTYGRRVYVYTQNADAAVTISQYDAVALDSGSWMKKVTSDISDTSIALPGGVALNTINPSRYGWILIAGYAHQINEANSGAIDVGDALILTSTDGRVGRVAAGTAPTYLPVAIADVADTNTYTCSGFVVCGNMWG